MSRPYLLVPPALPPDAYFRRPVARLPFPFRDERCSLYSHARHALWHGVRALGLGDGDEVLVPGYHCGTEIEALQQAGLGFGWYRAGDDLAPDERSLEAAIRPSTKALLLIHYLGFPQDVARWRRWCDDRGLLLIEDAAPAWLASIDGVPVGSTADLAVFSFRKTYAVPDGAALVCRAPSPKIPRARGRGLPMLVRRNLAWAAMNPGVSATGLRIVASHRTYDAQLDADVLAMGDPCTPPLAISFSLLARLYDPSTAERRREHYRFLLDRLGEHTARPFDAVPEGASPYMFPLTVAERDPVILRLRDHGVHAVPHWPISHPSCPPGAFPEADERRASIVGLPVHQDLRPRDLEFIVRAVEECLEPKAPSADGSVPAAAGRTGSNAVSADGQRGSAAAVLPDAASGYPTPAGKAQAGRRPQSEWRQRTLLPGDWVEVLPASEIRRMLDADQSTEGLPFMPEMLAYCGRRYRVALRAERTCVHPPEHPLRRMENAVVLRGVRCDGALHDGCQLGCMFLWKEAWLRKVEAGRVASDTPVSAAAGRGEPDDAAAPNGDWRADDIGGAADDALPALRVSPPGDSERFFCQATQLPVATEPGVPIWEPRQYLRFLRVRTLSLAELVAMFGRPLLRRARWLAASFVPNRVAPAAPPAAVEPSLGLQPGEWVEVRSRDEVLQTLDADGGLKGLYFNADMYRLCGERFEVRQRVERLIVERTGRLQQVRDTVILEGSICDRYRGCARGLPILWREAWLKRAAAPDPGTAVESAKSWTSA